ncbi:MAG: FAD-dependent oxidoreductase [Candidatus Pacebacteria bacterium]|nr:FAD-dependent oxidoreductase [Candidatus Paceibacterota bacterium]
MYDLIIIGGGPGGVAAGVYAARKKMRTALVTGDFGGQSVVSAGIENWIGTKTISGFDLAKSLEEHLRAQKDIEIFTGELVTAVTKKEDGTFSMTTKSGKVLDAKNIILASGSRRKRLGIPGEDRLDGKGVVFCTTCDAPLFGGQDVAVVGGANSALESVLDLIPYAKKIYLLVRGDALKGDPVTQDKVKTHPQVEVVFGAVPQEITGDAFVNGIRYQDKGKVGTPDETKTLAVTGVFVEVGLLPNSDFVKALVKTEPYGHVVVDPATQQTSCPGIWAIGDVTDTLYKQNNISVGEGVKAALNVYDKVKLG